MFRNIFIRMNTGALTDGHGPRHNILEINDIPIAEQNEATPLLRQGNNSRYRSAISSSNMAMICGLTVFFLISFGIGIYLLILQNKSENILPPINTDVYAYVPLSKWDDTKPAASVPSGNFKAQAVIMTETSTKQCWDQEGCLLVLKDMKENIPLKEFLFYNFLIANGIVYENIGWHSSPVPELNAVVIAFIGSFSYIPPTIEQINTAKNLLRAGMENNYLERNYTMIGKATKVIPKYLFRSFQNLPQWNFSLSDT